MKVYTTEEEQIEKIKQWLREYGLTILFAVIMVLLVSVGLRYWQNSQETMSEQASSSYEQMVISMMANQPQQAAAQATAIIQDYPKTPYAKLAALVMAQQDVTNNDLTGAAIELNWVAENSGKSAMAQIARIRLARVYAAEKQYTNALTTLNQVQGDIYSGAVQDVMGDVYAAQGNKTNAKIAYQKAMRLSPKNDAMVPLIQMKLADLASNPVAKAGV